MDTTCEHCGKICKNELGLSTHIGKMHSELASDECSVEGCVRPRAKHSSGRGRSNLCPAHKARKRKHGDVLPDIPIRHVFHVTGDVTVYLGYGSAHSRLKSVRGRASEHLCACGAPAKTWAYQHAATVEFSGTIVRGSREMFVRWSGDPEDYAPMCVPCHTKFDREHARN